MERRRERLLPRHVFYRRFGRFAAVAFALAVVSLLIGMAGYRWIEGQSWPEAFVNAAMLLSAMGPMGELKTDAGRIFAGCYALYSGLVFLFIAGLLVTPVAHRLLHLFHSDPEEDEDRDEGADDGRRKSPRD